MGILTVGLLGVAAMFPVGGFYLQQAEIADRGSAVYGSTLREADVMETVMDHAMAALRGAVMTDYRLGVAEARTADARNRLFELAHRTLGNAAAFLGRTVVWHASIAETKQIEALVESDPDMKRINAIPVAPGTHTPLNRELPDGRFADAEAFGMAGEGLSGADVAALTSAAASCRSAGEAITSVLEADR